jgi:hypothetical protein
MLKKKEAVFVGPSIRIELFRHDEKDEAEVDATARLTTKGRKGAMDAGKSKNPRLLQGYVVASPRERAMHTAVLQFFGINFADLKLEEHDFDTGFKNIENQLQTEHGVNISEKFSTDERLNFNVESHPGFKGEFYAQYSKSADNRTLDWQKNESDQLILDLARKTNPDDVLAEGIRNIKGFKRMAGDLAEVFLEYFQKISWWAEIFRKDPKNYDGDQMDVFVCSHSQNVECFLMRLIEMKEGPDFLEKFLSALPHRKSFIGYSEGFSMIVYENSGQPVAIIRFQGHSWEISELDLKQMIAEKDQFNQQVAEKLNETYIGV